VNSTEKFLNYVAILHSFTCSVVTFCLWWWYFPAVMTGISNKNDCFVEEEQELAKICRHY